MTRVLVTGGAGFIGSHSVHHALAAHPDWHVTVLDKLTYAGNLANLQDVKDHPRCRFLCGDIASRPDVEKATEGGVDCIFNFAAETHVDRSIGQPEGFIRTDISRASNNFGPRQHPTKVIPLFVTNALVDEPLPLYGDGENVRDWLFVADHCLALDVMLERGAPGEVYNIGAGNERRNIEITRL